MKGQIKWLCIMAGISCLLIGSVEFGSRARRFLHSEEEDINSAVSVEKVGENWQESIQEGNASEEGRDGKVGQGDSHYGDCKKEEAYKKKLPSPLSGIAGILKGSLGLAQKALAMGQKSELETDQIKGGRDLPSGEEVQSKEPPGLPVVYLVSDLHYMSDAVTDYGKAFETFQAKSDGKVVRYLPQIFDAFMNEAVNGKPDAVILTGDITMNGEKINHQKLAGKLAGLQNEGVQVLVIPGNHDINHPDARTYFGEQAQETAAVSPEEYGEIYADFGRNQAISCDEDSFSYIYALRDDVWLMLLDTAQYEPENRVEGMVRPQTLVWMDENLRKAKDQGIQVVVLGHHNLLSESRLFTTMCTLENSNDVTALLERYRVPLYISGHLHLQRTNRHKKGPGDTEYGIYEIVSDAVSIPPCQYGILSWQENKDMRYDTREIDVNAWALACSVEDENLLGFSDYKSTYIRQLIGEQIRGQTKHVREETSNDMARIYADAYADYCAGLKIDERKAMGSWEYKQWENCWPRSRQAKELRAMLGDCSRDYNSLLVPGIIP